MVGVNMEDLGKERTRKRPRMMWGAAPSGLEVQGSSGRPGGDAVSRHVSPPRRNDVHEGHYVYHLGENLTPRFSVADSYRTMVGINVEDLGKERTQKRPRMIWGAAQSELEVQGSSGRVREDAGSRHVSPPRRNDDHEGHYVYHLGENLTPRYKILRKMGEGTFGRVLECWDRQTREHVAIKVVRSIRKYRDAAMLEIDVLHLLGKNERGTSRCVQIRNWFDYRSHICIVFERLGPSLYDVLKRNKHHPFPVDLVRELGRQLLESVAYMHDLHLIHTDLKPENILLVSSDYVKLPQPKSCSSDDKHLRCLPKSSAIKLIDFGSTAFDNREHSSIVTTRHYRAPEVILGLGWTYPCDMWSVGCILVELCTGEALFQTHDNLEHLAMMERVLGCIPHHMARRVTPGAKKYFRRGFKLYWPEGAVSRESIRAVRRLDTLKNMVLRNLEGCREYLVDLLQGLMEFDPSERLTAHQALNHPFFKNSV